jgi:hypothetical protein
MTPIDDDDQPMDPAESLRLIERERAEAERNLIPEAERNLIPDPRLFLWPWGFAWLIGFTVYFLRFGPDGRVFVDMPKWVPLIVLLGALIAAGVVTGITGARAGRWISGPSSAQGAMYGISWSIAFVGMSVVLGRVSDYLPGAQQNLLWAGAMVGLAATLHMAGGAIYNDRTLFGLGAYVSVINVIGVLIGPGWHSLILAVAGGLGMIVAGLIGVVRLGYRSAP